MPIYVLVRTDAYIGNSLVSVSFTAISLAKQIFNYFTDVTALLMGVGETIKFTARHLRDNSMSHIIIVNHTIGKSRNIILQADGYLISLNDIYLYLAGTDIVIGSTVSQSSISDRKPIQRALKELKRKPILMIDIFVPRDIE